MISILHQTGHSRETWEVRFAYDADTVSDFKSLTRGAASWDRAGRCWEVYSATMAARVQAWADERNAPEVAEREAAAAARGAAEKADRDAAEVIVAAAHARHPGRLARVGQSLMLCLVPQDIRLRGDVKAVLTRHGMSPHSRTMYGGVSLDRTDRETDTSYATRLVAAVEEVLALVHGDDDAVAHVDLGDASARAPKTPAPQTVEPAACDRPASTDLADPAVCRQAVWQFNGAHSDAEGDEVLRHYGLASYDDLLAWERKHSDATA